MKTIIGIFALCIIGHLQAQEPETVLSIVVERHEIGWYEVQLDLWKKEIDKDTKNAEAWYNYYSSSRALKNLSEGDERKRYTELCTTIATDAYTEVPETFEANHLAWWDGGNDKAKVPFLLKAHEIAPDDVRAYDDLMINYEMQRDQENFREMCTKLYDANEVPGSILNWGYNVLAGLKENAVIFTAGDNDTYALWLIQGAKGFRTDVTVVNTHLILIEEYRALILNELGIPKMEDKDGNIFKHIFKNTSDIPVYVAISALREFDNPEVKDNLYLTGLAYVYSSETCDNLSVIRRNYEKLYLIDYLKTQFTTHRGDAVAGHFEGLYLPSMVKLLKHYRTTEELEKARELEAVLQSLILHDDQKEYLNKILEEGE